MQDPVFKREATVVLFSLGLVGLLVAMFIVALWAFLGATSAAMTLTAVLAGLFVAVALLAIIAVRWEGSRRAQPPHQDSAH